MLKTIAEAAAILKGMTVEDRVKHNLSGAAMGLEIAHDLLMQAAVVEVAVEPVEEA